MKKSIFFLIFIILIGSTFGCERKNEIILSDSIYTILKEDNVHVAQINKLGDYSKYQMEDVVETAIIVSQKEIDEYCAIQLESFAEIVPIENRNTVVAGDVVYINYLMYQGENLINQIENDNLVVGSGNYDEKIEDALIGKEIGVPFRIMVDVQNIGLCELDITVKSINRFVTYELTDAFVKEKFNVDTVEEYYRDCEKVIKEGKLEEEKRKKEKELFLSIIQSCEFTLDKNEVAEYSLKYVEEYQKLAEVYGLELEEYIEKILNRDVEQFYQECYELGEYEIKKILLIGAIYADLELKITEKQYRDMCEKQGYEVEKVKENKYEDSLIRYYIMQEEVLKLYM